jgi:hypothetical protein
MAPFTTRLIYWHLHRRPGDSIDEYSKDFMYFCLACNFSYPPKIQGGVIIPVCPLCKETKNQEVLQTGLK